MKHLLLGLLLATAIQASSQYSIIDRNPHMLILISGDTLTGQNLSLVHPIFQDAIFQLDTIKVKTPEVRYFKNNHGMFGYLPEQRLHDASCALRIRKGRINLFEEVELELYSKEELIEANNTRRIWDKNQLAKGDKIDYYSKGLGPLKPVKYRSMVIDLADNELSMRYLKNYRMYQWLQRSLLGSGVALLASGIVLRQMGAVYVPALLMGGVLASSSAFVEFPKRDYIWYAFEAYE